MKIEKIEEKIIKVDSLLTTFSNFLKKHWFILLLISFGYFIYWSLTTDFHDDYYFNRDGQIELLDYNSDIPFIIESYIDYYQDKEVLIHIWSDGYETWHHLDGSPLIEL